MTQTLIIRYPFFTNWGQGGYQIKELLTKCFL